MAIAVEKTIIRASLEAVFDYRLNLANLPRYNPGVSELRPDAESYRFRVRLMPGVTLPCKLTVTEATRPSRIRFAIESMFNAEEICLFESTAEGIEVRLETHIATPGGALGKLLDAAFVVPTAHRQLKRELALMKIQLEGQRRTEP